MTRSASESPARRLDGAKLMNVNECPPSSATAGPPWSRSNWMSGMNANGTPMTSNRFGMGRRRLVFPAIFLIYLLQTVGGIAKHSDGVWAIVGYCVLGAFSICYLATLPAVWTGNDRRFRIFYVALVGLTVAEVPLAHEAAFVMFIYVAIVGIAYGARWALPAAAFFAATALFLPPLIGPWHASFDGETALSLGVVSLGMWAFFGIIRTNHALEEARAQVFTLAAEGERNRIARDLHDLLGHSLTTITVKAGLAKRLAEHDPARAAIEIGEVEELARRSLTDVRAAVSNYRIVTLATELATAHEVLRAAGIDARVLRPTDTVDPDLHELFGWVVREGTTNVVRHSRATRCTITLGSRSIEIADDGQGSLGGPSGNGIAGLRERVSAAGGTVEAEAARGGGWRLWVEVP